jgi:hypothetical protein
MSEITIEDIEKDNSVTPDIVAARSRCYQFKGKPLKPFSKSRSTAARCMGNSLFLGRARPDENGVWDQITLDSIMVVWLCSVEDSRVARACLNRDQAIIEMMAWWDKEGGEIGGAEEIEAVQLLNMICEDIQTVSASVESPSGGRDTSNVGE